MKDFAEFDDLLRENLQVSPAEFAIRYGAKSWYSRSLATQLAGMQKAQHKLPQWFANPHIIYPPLFNIEQSSSQSTAHYKASLCSGELGVDLNCGFGVDAFFMAKKFDRYWAIEQNEELAEITRHNFHALGSTNIECITADAKAWINSQSQNFDLIYVDPDRRAKGYKTIKIVDSEPNVLDLYNSLTRKPKQFMVKFSPMFDIEEVIQKFPKTESLHIVSVQGECKELLAILTENSIEAEIVGVDLNAKTELLAKGSLDDTEAPRQFASGVKSYLYEPHAALIKSKLMHKVAKESRLDKLHPNTQLFTSDNLVPTFNGKVFKVIRQISGSKDLDRDTLARGVQIIQRNYPLGVEELYKKLKVSPGDGAWVVGLKSQIGNQLYLCERIFQNGYLTS